MISCVYCGGEHQRPADVKQCWADHEGEQVLVDTADQEAAESADRHSSKPSSLASLSTARSGDRPERRSRSDVAVRRGPTSLGRNVVVGAGATAPAEWDGSARVTVDRAAVANPGPAIELLRSAAHAATGLVIELTTEFDEPPGSTEDRLPHQVGVAHSFELDDLHQLVWSNAVDARDATAGRWTLVDRAVEAGASIVEPGSGTSGDIVTPDGHSVWLAAGPIRYHGEIDGVGVVHEVQIDHGRFAVVRTNATTADLAPDQLAAVTHAGGSARIIAPAGSGKTRVLTERARHLIDAWRLPPGAVSLVAFNKRAQEEMRARTSDLPGLQVRTVNAIALAIANGVAPFAPQPRSWRTIDEPDVRRILQRFVTVPRRRNTDPMAPWIDALSLVRLGLVDPVEVEARYGGDVDGLGDVYPHYLDALERDGLVDFDGQIHRAITVLLTQPAARRAAQRVSRVLLVDEFQDLTPAHLLLIRLLAGAGGSVFGVGDDDQTIYGYNGADPSWLIDFASWFPGAGDHPLEVNYRCPAGIVTIADRLVRHNRRRVAKTIRAASTEAGGWSATSSDDPVDVTVGAVRAALEAGASPSDVAVLTRVNATIAPVQVALSSCGLAVAGGVGTEFVERTAIRSALAWLRLAAGSAFTPDDVREALRRPSRPLHPRIGDWAGEQRDVEAMLRLADRLTNERDATRVREFAGDIGRLQALASSGATVPALLDVLVDDIGLGGAIATLDHSRRGMNRSAQGDDLLALRQLARLHAGDSRAAPFDRWLRDHLSARRDPAGVVLATVHRVKGQEWPHVVVHLADVDQYPHRLADEPEEERRLFHVAITRASEHVTVVSGELPSPFVAELTTEPPEHPLEAPAAGRSSRRSAAPRATQRRGTDRDEHPLLDRGRVVAVAGLVLVDQGQEWVITDLEPESAVAERDGATRRFGIGSKVETAGKQRGRLGVRPGEVGEASVRAFDLLRQFRDRARNGKPAYTVFDDKTLAAISSALPVDLDSLSRVKGVGPAKLELYGDDVLSLVTEAVDA